MVRGWWLIFRFNPAGVVSLTVNREETMKAIQKTQLTERQVAVLAAGGVVAMPASWESTAAYDLYYRATSSPTCPMRLPDMAGY